MMYILPVGFHTLILKSVLFCFRCLNYGVFSHKKSEKLLTMLNERKKKLGGASGTSSSPAPKKKKAKLVKEEAIDPGIQESGADFVGSSVL